MTNQIEAPEPFYHAQLAQLQASLQIVNEKRKRIAWQRLLVIVGLFLLLYETWTLVTAPILGIEAIACLAFFLFLVSKDTNAKNDADRLQSLIAINETELHILQNDFSGIDTGEQYGRKEHPYAQDLDVFGSSSLYQLLNRCTSEQGKQLLAQRLLHPLPKDAILSEQPAMLELVGHTHFRQQLQALGSAQTVTLRSEQNILHWLQQPPAFESKKWMITAIVYPIVMLSVCVIYLAGVINTAIFSLVFLVGYLFSSSTSKKIDAVYDLLSNAAKETETFCAQINLIEQQAFRSEKLATLQQEIKSASGESASKQIGQLQSILNRFNVRLNTFAFFFINLLFLWDVQQMLALNKWKARNQNGVSHWFRAIAEVEFSSSLATLRFNKPEWCLPEISDVFFGCSGENIGHPLLHEAKRVDNSFSIEGRGKIAIITGSNMGGKSTFLRSIGVNTVLALLGAPVCAQTFSVSVAQLMSSMRVADNLAENTSTFYAELRKLKTIIEAVNYNEPVFILLDEILRGTNSLDRHTGSAALLKQFIHKNAVAIIATHDVELAGLEKDFPTNVNNYHFDVQTEGSELYFDYKLKNGICKSMNASVLMKNIGIELL